jgi:hypothetical protein
MSIEGVGDITMATDTGSTGIIISKGRIANYDALVLAQNAPTVPHFLSSSSRLYTGKLLRLKVAFPGKSLADGSAITASGTVPILAVEKLETCPWYPKDERPRPVGCPERPAGDDRPAEEQDSTGVQYMGVGFGRDDTDPKGFSMPWTNSFLAMDTINDRPTTTNAGWIIGTKGVVLGLTSENTQNFDWEALPPGQLQTTSEPRDWKAVTAATSIDQTSLGGVNTCAIDSSCHVQGTVLIDTGLDYMFIRMPKENYSNISMAQNSDGDNILPKGTVLTTSLSAPCNASSAGSYTFTFGEGSGVEPTYARPLAFEPADGSFVNTGRNFLRGHDIAFDAVNGRFGLRAVGAADGLGNVSK